MQPPDIASEPASKMFEEELAAIPKALRQLAEDIKAADYAPAMCLRDAAAMIESLKMQRDTARKALTREREWMNRKMEACRALCQTILAP